MQEVVSQLGQKPRAASAVDEGLTLDRAAFERSMRALHWPSFWWDSQLVHPERLPEGAALFVGNHGPFGLDAPFLMALVYRYNGRALRGMVDRLFFASPATRQFARQVGVMKASRENAVRALRDGQYVLTYPGGIQEAMRSPSERYTLHWKDRTGFVQAAVEAGVPIVPVACIGLDDLYFQLIDHEHMALTPWGKYVAANHGAEYVLPFVLGPLPGELRYHIGEPIELGIDKRHAKDAAALTEGKERVETALTQLIADGLADRETRSERLIERARRSVTGVLELARDRMRTRFERAVAR